MTNNACAKYTGEMATSCKAAFSNPKVSEACANATQDNYTTQCARVWALDACLNNSTTDSERTKCFDVSTSCITQASEYATPEACWISKDRAAMCKQWELQTETQIATAKKNYGKYFSPTYSWDKEFCPSYYAKGFCADCKNLVKHSCDTSFTCPSMTTLE